MVTKTSGWIIAGISMAAVATAVYIAYNQYSGNIYGKGVKKDLEKIKKKRKRPLPSNSSSSAVVQKSNEPLKTEEIEKPESKVEEVAGDTKKASTKKISKVDCDSPIEEIVKESQETQQKLFMEMMMRAEFLIQQNQVDRAIDYLVKALSMIPNPGEVLLAFEQTLPQTIFKNLLDRLQKEGKKRVMEYFDAIHKEMPQISFDSKESKNEMTGHSADRWFMKAGIDFQEGQVIFKESADILSRTIASTGQCDVCLKTTDSGIACEKCSMGEYCSVQCQAKGWSDFHSHVCRGENEKSAELFNELLAHCRYTKSSAALILFKYVSLLLNAEMQNGAAGITASGPFAHYDHLRPAFRQPNENDLKEARLLRAIFTRSNANMQDFLTDDIYAAMKYTLLFNCYGFNDNIAPPESDADGRICEEHVRNVKSSDQAKWIGLYHIASHIEHSCSPSCRIEANADDNSIAIIANSSIQKNSPITLAYLPGLSDNDKETRQVRLLSKLGIICECAMCHLLE